MRKFTLLFILFAMITNGCCGPKQETADKSTVVLDNIFSRKSVRSYTSEKVPDEMLLTLVKAGMAAPSAMNRQPWEFIIINDRDTLDILAGQLKYAKMLQQAQAAIVVCAETMIKLSDGTVVENMFWEHDASAATQNILLAAEAMGLGAVWTAASDPERSALVCATLGITGTVKPLCVIPIGWPAGNDQPKDKWKPEKVHYNRW